MWVINYLDIIGLSINIFRVRSLNLVSIAKSVILYFLYHNCGNMWPVVQRRRRHISVKGQGNPPAAEEIGMKRYKYIPKQYLVGKCSVSRTCIHGLLGQA